MKHHAYRPAVIEDVPLILEFIRSLADYEVRLDEVCVTEEALQQWLFEKKRAHVLFALDETGREVGFALYYHRFSSYLGRCGIYLEDLFVLPTERGKGYGRSLLAKLSQLVRDDDGIHLEWRCLKWNHHSIDFYKSLGAQTLDECVTFRLDGSALVQLSEEA